NAGAYEARQSLPTRRSSDLISPVSDHSKETGTRPPPGHGLSRLERLWLCEAVRLREEQAGPLEDGEAVRRARLAGATLAQRLERSEEHTSELQSRENLVCRL